MRFASCHRDKGNKGNHQGEQSSRPSHFHRCGCGLGSDLWSIHGARNGKPLSQRKHGLDMEMGLSVLLCIGIGATCSEDRNLLKGSQVLKKGRSCWKAVEHERGSLCKLLSDIACSIDNAKASASSPEAGALVKADLCTSGISLSSWHHRCCMKRVTWGKLRFAVASTPLSS